MVPPAALSTLLVALATSAPLLPDHQCEHLPEARALACSCSRSSLLLPPLATLLGDWPGRTIESLALSSCGSLDLTINTTGLQQPLLQVLVDTVDYLTVRGLDLPPQHTLDLHVSGVTKQANLMGDLACSSCTSNSTLPNLNVQVTDSPLLVVQRLKVKEVILRMKTRNVGHVKVHQSDLGGLEGSGLEVFYSSSLEVRDTRFHLPDVAKEVLVLNHVGSLLVDHVTGLSTTSYSILSNDTRVEVYCSPPPLAPWDTPVCGPPPLGTSPSLAQALPGAWARPQWRGVVVTLVVGVLLVASTLTVLVMHRRGKLDRLL